MTLHHKELRRCSERPCATSGQIDDHRQFYVRRSLRIFPIYYTVLLLLALLYSLSGAQTHSSDFFRALPFYLTYTSNWTTVQAGHLGITWSLAAEEQFYFIWPAIEKLLKPRNVLIALLVSLGVNQMVNFGMLDEILQDHLGVVRSDLCMLQITFTPILLGVGLAHLLHDRNTFPVVYKIVKSRSSPVVLFAMIFLFCNELGGDVNGWQRLVIQLLLAVLLASCVVRENHALRAFLAWRPFARIGAISYGMYLYHMFARHFAVEICKRASMRFPESLFVLTVLITIGMAELSYRWYESPFLSLKNRFLKERLA